MSRQAPRPKDAIQTLCRLLSSLRLGTVSPEQFRQAKYNRPESVPVFWMLLSRVLACTTGDDAATAVLVENGNVEATAVDPKMPDGDVISNVKAGLLYHGYVAPEMFQPGGGQQPGCLELLLAFSWLLHTTHFPLCLMSQGTLQLYDGAMAFLPEVASDGRPGEERRRCGRPSAGARLPEDGARYTLWLVGKLRLRMRALHAARRQHCTLLHRVHSACRHAQQAGTHLSSTEAYLLKHSNGLAQVLQQLGEENARLEAFIEWKKVEPAFWQWMESVVEVKLMRRDYRGSCPSLTEPCHWGNAGGVRDTALDSRLSSVGECLTRIERDVSSTLRKTRTMWRGEERRLLQHGGAIPSALPDLTESAQREASEVVRGLQSPAQRLAATLLLQLPFRLLLKQQGRASDSLGTLEVPLCEVTRELAGRLARLHASLREQRQLWRERLDTIVDTTEGIVCLPPPRSHHR